MTVFRSERYVGSEKGSYFIVGANFDLEIQIDDAFVHAFV